MKEIFYDIAVLGCGPAGLSAAINAIIRNKKVVVFGTDVCSPPLHKAQKIDNYLGFMGIRGEDLLYHFLEHAQSMNVEIVPNKIELITPNGDGTFSLLVSGEVIQSKAIIISTGIPYKPTLPQETEYLGRGLGYCATCDGPLYRGKDVILIAHDQEGEAEANYMAEICNKVYYLPLYKNIGQLNPGITVISAKPAEIIGDTVVKGLKLKDGTQISADGLFILGGETAPDRIIPGLEIADNHIVVDRQQKTNIAGVYAAGDCTGKPYQVAKSVGEGQVAGLSASSYVAALK
jgi:thioredoxin reductase (NADPH)